MVKTPKIHKTDDAGANTSATASEDRSGDQYKAHKETGPVAVADPVTPPAQDKAGQGTTFTDNSEATEQGGAGDSTGPAWVAFLELNPEETQRSHPLLREAVEAWRQKMSAPGATLAEPTIRIAAKRDGFRRCGIAHPKAATNYPIVRFTPDEVERLLAEPKLKVELV